MNYLDIQPDEIQALRAEGDLIVFDTRDPDSYARGHLEGAQPITDAAIKQLIKSRCSERPVLIYCYRGNSSRDFCGVIASFGFTRVYNLAGGWQAWEKFSRPAPVALVAKQISADLTAWLSHWGFPVNNIHARAENGMSPIMLASLKGKRALVEELLSLGADPNHVNDDDHHALWFACVNGDPELVSLLIAHGANIDNQNVNGATCAIYTASTGKLEVLKRLVEAGANLHKETSGGYTALESASTLPVLKYLREWVSERPLMSAA